MEQDINTPITQTESVIQNNQSFLNNKIFQTFILVLVVAIVSSSVTRYVISNKTETNLVTNNGEVVNPNSTDNLPAIKTENKKEDVQLDRIKNGSTISSPLVLRGTVAQGWMFEGQFTVQVWGADGKLIMQAPLGDLYDGGWVESDPVAFEGKVEFTTDQKTGTLVFKKDNASGLPENDKNYTISVNFAKKDFQALLKDICKYQGANIYPNYIYKVSDLPIKNKDLSGDDLFWCFGEGLENAYLSLDLFNSADRKTSVLIYDEASMEGGHGGPPFLGFYGTEIYNKDNIRIGAYLVISMGDLYVKDIVNITLRGERTVVPAGFETIYINTTESVDLEDTEMLGKVSLIASNYLVNGSTDVIAVPGDIIDLNKYTEFEIELVNAVFDSSKVSPKHQKIIDEMISDLNSFEAK
ncbi:MAG: hypothetical protein O2871_01725 [bacterium]|nr:hypothetical protein [bacterium]